MPSSLPLSPPQARFHDKDAKAIAARRKNRTLTPDTIPAEEEVKHIAAAAAAEDAGEATPLALANLTPTTTTETTTQRDKKEQIGRRGPTTHLHTNHDDCPLDSEKKSSCASTPKSGGSKSDTSVKGSSSPWWLEGDEAKEFQRPRPNPSEPAPKRPKQSKERLTVRHG